MARGSRGSRGGKGRHSGRSKSHSSKNKRFVAGKITGQYLAKGYSESRAKHIGNVVTNRMYSTFRSGPGSKRSYARGINVGYSGKPSYNGQNKRNNINHLGVYNNLNNQKYQLNHSRCNNISNNIMEQKHESRYKKNYKKKYEKNYK